MATHEQGPVVGGHRRNNKRTLYDGRWYQSKMEAKFAERLDLEKRAGIIRDWTPQFRIPLEIPPPSFCPQGPDAKVGVYVVDFDVHYANGRRVLIETKGFWTRESKFKRRVFEATWLRTHPDVEYRVVVEVGRFGAAVDEAPPAPRIRAPRQKSMSAADFRAMNGGSR